MAHTRTSFRWLWVDKRGSAYGPRPTSGPRSFSPGPLADTRKILFFLNRKTDKIILSKNGSYENSSGLLIYCVYCSILQTTYYFVCVTYYVCLERTGPTDGVGGGAGGGGGVLGEQYRLVCGILLSKLSKFSIANAAIWRFFLSKIYQMRRLS